MKQAYKKRSHEATANSPPVLSDMGKLLYKSGKFIKKSIPPLLNDLYLDITIIKREKFSFFFIFLLHNILYLRRIITNLIIQWAKP